MGEGKASEVSPHSLIFSLTSRRRLGAVRGLKGLPVSSRRILPLPTRTLLPPLSAPPRATHPRLLCPPKSFPSGQRLTSFLTEALRHLIFLKRGSGQNSFCSTANYRPFILFGHPSPRKKTGPDPKTTQGFRFVRSHDPEISPIYRPLHLRQCRAVCHRPLRFY